MSTPRPIRPFRILAATLGVVGIAVSIYLALYWRPTWPLPVTITHAALEVDGARREYRLAIPHSTQGKTNLPVVFALHGALDTVDEMATYTDLDRLAADKGFLLVYLQGRLLNWPPCIPEENPTYIDADLHFFEAAIDEMVRNHHADRKRVYVLGVSQGGAMANLITAKRSELIAATVCSCGWMPRPLDEQALDTKNKCPILFVVGSEDTQVPPAMVQKACDAFKKDGHPTEFRIIPGLGHGWPRDPKITAEIWAFLTVKQLP